MTDVAERWNSACDMLEQLFEQQPAICAALLSAEVWENVKELWALTEADLVCAKDVTTSWKPLDAATHTTLEEKSPSGQPCHSACILATDSTVTKEIKNTASWERGYVDLGKRYMNDKPFH